MKFIKAICDKQRPHFSKGGKFEKLAPLFNATETFFFIPGDTTRNDTHIRDGLDLKRFMSFVIIALMPSFLFGVYNAGYQSNLSSGLNAEFIPAIISGFKIVIPLVIVSYSVGFFWEILFASIRRHPISEGFLVTGLLFPMTLPPTLPLWQAAVGISFGVVIGKEIFGGTGRNILNPALTARAFVFFAYAEQMSGDKIWTVVKSASGQAADAVSGATPLAVSTLAGAGADVEKLLSESGYPLLKLFLGNYPGSIGATSVLACLLGAVFLVATGIASYRIMIGGVAGVCITGLVLNLFVSESSLAWFSMNPIYHLVMGGFAFGIVFMATDPVSAPGMDRSKWIYGFLIGMLTVMIRVFNPAFPEGVMLAILFMNLFSPLLDYFEIKTNLKKRISNV